MGAGQSSTGDSGTKSSDIKTSYYELLGVERTATEDEIKKAYRRKALELHPDRNYGNVEAATRLFAEIQSAHEVLSDPQERAWYDSHESAILRGDDPMGDDAGEEVYEGNVAMTSADDIARMIRKFNSNVAFTDAPSGFFGYLNETFEHLAKEEEIASRIDGSNVLDYPLFGHKDDEYEDVVRPFYSYWASFATRKSFKWKDRYRLSEAPDRRYRRAMEKENQKFRDEGIREFNDAVRSLVAFIRKRDPRVIQTQQSEEERQKVLREAAQAQAARARRQNEEKLKDAVPDWAQVVQKDELEGEIEDEESEEEHFECVACRKTFKSEKQWEAHEKSKKHQKAVQGLRRKMKKDDINLDLDGEGGSGAVTPPTDGGQDVPRVESEVEEVTGSNDGLETELEHVHLDDIDDSQTAAVEKVEMSGTTHDEELEDLSEGEEEEEAEDDDADREAIKQRLTSINGIAVESDDEDVKAAPTQPKLGKAAQKRAKKAAAAVADQEENKFKCGVCNAAFPSKRRMFQHIEDLGHAVAKTAVSGQAKGKGKKGKR